MRLQMRRFTFVALVIVVGHRSCADGSYEIDCIALPGKTGEELPTIGVPSVLLVPNVMESTILSVNIAGKGSFSHTSQRQNSEFCIGDTPRVAIR